MNHTIEFCLFIHIFVLLFELLCVSQTDRYAVLSSEQSNTFDVFIYDVGRDDQNGGVGVTQFMGAVNLTNGPAFIWETLAKQIQPQERNHKNTEELNV